MDSGAQISLVLLLIPEYSRQEFKSKVNIKSMAEIAQFLLVSPKFIFFKWILHTLTFLKEQKANEKNATNAKACIIELDFSLSAITPSLAMLALGKSNAVSDKITGPIFCYQ